MGRDWSLGGKSSKKEAGGKETPPAGCFNALLQLFDFHNSNFALHQPHSSFKPADFTEDATSFKGVEAPRNSLESEQLIVGTSPSSSNVKNEESLNIPMGIRIRTNTKTSRNAKAQMDDSYSPSTKTPTLVARLMGLDILPEDNLSPLSSNSFRKTSVYQNSTGTRSLPETPRISSARRSDVDHRLSLQINKENIFTIREDLEFFGGENFKNSSSQYAKQISKHVKESVRRRFGTDLTNTARSKESRRDELLVPVKPRKNKPIFSKDQKISMDNRTVKVYSKEKLQPLKEQKKCPKAEGYKKSSVKRPPQKLDTIRNKKEETFVRPSSMARANISAKKCKKTSFSGDLHKINVPTFLPVRKDPSNPLTKLPQEQTQSKVSDAQPWKQSSLLSSCSSPSTYDLKQQDDDAADRADGSSTTGIDKPDFDYVKEILNRTKTKAEAPFSSIFQHLSNRKLLFHLVDEILTETLKPYVGLKPRVRTLSYEELINIVWTRIRSFPSANCKVLQDIDALISKDLPEARVTYEAEGEAIVEEIEGEIVDWLVRETAAFFSV